ncbi:putative endopeptidase precursor [Actinomadura rubteroloni]|uniref:Putative endopeptidase n=1 Tax=Actinomadura rubteroloni TaxID=1926885 RepID=A0A2P4UGH4_9ACTN|nr:C40 family peptidase [Actinomadura rubteroloni]POM24151.1 putative endopeptidase precursor [Actinomadura rubteroloni]
MAEDDLTRGSVVTRSAPDTRRRGRKRRLTAAACLAVAFSLPLPMTAHAAPKPTEAETKKKIEKLNEKSDAAVERYNQATERLKAAKKKLDAARKASKAEEQAFEKERQHIAELAATAYKNSDTDGLAGFVGSKDPQAILDQSSILTHLSQNRDAELAQYVAAVQRLKREQEQAQQAYDDYTSKTKDARKEKQNVDKQLAQQKKILAKFGVKNDKPGTGAGGTYTGPASGSARAALNFAYAQLGKPYVYGAAGPNSYDCSGLTMRSWGAAGVNITRTTNSQWAATKRVSQSDLQAGDLVFFNSLGHVGMYVGGGKIIHAPHTGTVVKIVPLSSMPGYYGAGRP